MARALSLDARQSRLPVSFTKVLVIESRRGNVSFVYRGTRGFADMKVSTKGRYGLRFMMDLAAHQRDGNVTLREVSQRQAISEKYLWQVANPLKKEGLIRAVAGPGGGFTLTRAPTAITLGDILAVLEGNNALVACNDEPATCARSNACAAREVWRDVGQKLTETLNSITLADMAEKQRTMEQRSVKEYCI
jgi:Rrf2 family transcriptional regulator, cysteine metabolism repressor